MDTAIDLLVLRAIIEFIAFASLAIVLWTSFVIVSAAALRCLLSDANFDRVLYFLDEHRRCTQVIATALGVIAIYASVKLLTVTAIIHIP